MEQRRSYINDHYGFLDSNRIFCETIAAVGCAPVPASQASASKEKRSYSLEFSNSCLSISVFYALSHFYCLLVLPKLVM